MWKLGLFLILAVPVALNLPAFAQDEQNRVGSITDVKGPVFLVREGKEVAASEGARLYTSDVLKTGQEGGVGVVLRDDSTLSLGPSSELKMSDFKFKPDQGMLAVTLSVAKGTLVYISGQIAKLAPGSARIETPAGVAAVRGTELLIEVPQPKGAKRSEKKS